MQSAVGREAPCHSCSLVDSSRADPPSPPLLPALHCVRQQKEHLQKRVAAVQGKAGELKDLQQENVRLLGENQHLSGVVSRLEEERAAARARLEDCQAQLRGARQELQAATARGATLGNRLKQLQRERQLRPPAQPQGAGPSPEEDGAPSSCPDACDGAARARALTAQLATLQAELRARETALSEANAQRGALEQRLRAREHEAEAAVAQLRLEAAEVRGSLEAQRAAASQRAEEAESVLARERLRLAELQAEVDALGAERDSVARLYEKTQAELSAARREDLGAQQTASLVQSMKREREACLAELQQASGEKKALRAQLAQAQRELAEARESLADREAQVGRPVISRAVRLLGPVLYLPSHPPPFPRHVLLLPAPPRPWPLGCRGGRGAPG